MKLYWTYILTSRKNGTLYTGVTGDLSRRMVQHRDGKGGQFTSTHSVKRLVWCEEFSNVLDAITREKQIKAWRRQWKINLINESNPEWDDLFDSFLH